MTDEELLAIEDEIIAYCDKTNNYSYYDMKAYAYKNKPEWIEALNTKWIRVSVAEHLKWAKRNKGLKYETPMYVALSNCHEAAVEANGEYKENYEIEE